MTNTLSFPLPKSLDRIQHTKAGKAWLDRVPGLIEKAMTTWNLDPIQTPYPGSTISLCFPTVYKDKKAVLKISASTRSTRTEPIALQAWKRHGAVPLFDFEATTLLLEQCQPGTPLAHQLQSKNHLSLELARLTPPLPLVPNHPFTTLNTLVESWQTEFTHQLSNLPHWADKDHVEQTASLLAHLKDTQDSPDFLINADIHPGNILAHQGTWVVIDPRPVAGEKAFAAAPVVCCAEFGHSKAQTYQRLSYICNAWKLDKTRARAWAQCQSLLWALNQPKRRYLHETSQWLAM